MLSENSVSFPLLVAHALGWLGVVVVVNPVVLPPHPGAVARVEAPQNFLLLLFPQPNEGVLEFLQ